MTTLKEAREARGIMQHSVADAIGVTRQTYAKYEVDPDMIRIRDVKKACEFIGCDPTELSFFAPEGD